LLLYIATCLQLHLAVPGVDAPPHVFLLVRHTAKRATIVSVPHCGLSFSKQTTVFIHAWSMSLPYLFIYSLNIWVPWYCCQYSKRNTGWVFWQSRFNSQVGHIFFSSPKFHSDTKPPIQWVPRSLSLWAKQPEPEANYSPIGNGGWDWIDLHLDSPYAFMACTKTLL
jgi:hypothetical protein